MGSFHQREEYKQHFQNEINVDLKDKNLTNEDIQMMCSVLDRVETCVSQVLDLSKNKINFRG